MNVQEKLYKVPLGDWAKNEVLKEGLGTEADICLRLPCLMKIFCGRPLSAPLCGEAIVAGLSLVLEDKS